MPRLFKCRRAGHVTGVGHVSRWLGGFFGEVFFFIVIRAWVSDSLSILQKTQGRYRYIQQIIEKSLELLVWVRVERWLVQANVALVSQAQGPGVRFLSWAIGT